ncbi:MAG TPA: hypothetical protein VK993_14270 [Chthoniobacterales bacterium]|nr:hypothetical protein [Chthoniobacterales bacterium]
MKRFPHTTVHGRRLCGVLGALAFAVAVQASWANETLTHDEATNAAKNLARMNCGAKIQCILPDGRAATVASANDGTKGAAALIMDDDTLSVPLQEGETTFIITLPTTSLVDRFSFVNENAAARGQLKIAVSNHQLPAASAKWVEVDGHIPFTNKRLFNVSMMGVEARYVKLSFKVEKGGRIAALGLYGDETLQRFAQRQQQLTWIANTSNTAARDEDRLNFNFANLYAEARVVYVSSGAMAAARSMIDDDNETGFRFSPADEHPTVIVELAESERLNRVSALYETASGRMDVYLLNELGQNPGDLGGAKPVASVTDRSGDGKAAVDFDPQGARYLALRWTPEGSRRGTNTFEVAEINAFGNVPLAMLQLFEAPDVFASNSASVQAPGTSGPVAIPPSLPNVSP